MKNLFGLSFLLGVSLIFLSCAKTKDDINEATEFDINYSTSLAIPSSSVSVNVPADFSTPEISSQSATRFAAEKTTKELVDEVKMSKFTLSTTTGDLSFLKSLGIFIKASGMSEVAVATKTLIAAGSTSVSADLSDTNIKEYIFKDKFQFRVSVVVNTGLSTNQDLKLEQTIHVKGKKIK